jgi:hypothetical protein
MHVLRVDLARKTVSVRPLLESIAQRSPLSALARHHPRLVAATNTGYFDFSTGAPTDPLIVGGVPLVVSSAHRSVVGLDSAGQVEAAKVWSSSTLTAGSNTYKLVGVNQASPPSGIVLYTSKWGSAPVPGRWATVSRGFVNGAVTASRLSRRGTTVPSGGSLLVARGQAASQWLSSLPTGTKVSIASVLKTDAPQPFVQAYGVGVQLVATAGVAISGFSCDSSNTSQPARTAIGFANGGRTLVLAVVADRPFTSMHGLDEDQMSKLMAQLGVSQAYAFDGSGSSELLAKTRGASALILQNHPADGQQRPMPLGLGISVIPTKPKHHKH